jgi:hypothetical protein
VLSAQVAWLNHRKTRSSILAEIEYLAKSAEGKLRHPFGRISFTRNTGREFDSPRSLENEKEAAN